MGPREKLSCTCGAPEKAAIRMAAFSMGRITKHARYVMYRAVSFGFCMRVSANAGYIGIPKGLDPLARDLGARSPQRNVNRGASNAK